MDVKKRRGKGKSSRPLLSTRVVLVGRSAGGSRKAAGESSLKGNWISLIWIEKRERKSGSWGRDNESGLALEGWLKVVRVA